MSYDTNLQESQMEALPEFYKFTCGGESTYYTNADVNLSFIGFDWLAAPLKRTAISRDNQFTALQMQISCLITDQLGQFIANNPVQPVQVDVYRALESDLTDYRVLFRGIIKKAVVKDRQMQLTCIAMSQYLHKKLPPYIYQPYCNHTLFDSKCLLARTAYRLDTQITGISGADIVSADFATKADGYFEQGVVIFANDQRLVLKHISNTLTLQIPFSGIQIGSSVSAYPGCDKNPATCKNKFNNLNNFLGFPYIPSHNICMWGFRS